MSMTAAPPAPATRTSAGDKIHARALELLRANRDGSLYRKAAETGMNLSNFLADEDEKAQVQFGGYRDGLDPFQRLIMLSGIRTRSVPGRGVWANEMGAFFEHEDARSLIPEWIARQWRRVRDPFGKLGVGSDIGMGIAGPYGDVNRDPNDPQQRAFYGSDMLGLGTVMRPYYDEAMARASQIAPAVPLSEVVAMTTPVDGDAYRAFYLTDVTAQERLVRVGQAAELPRARLTGGDHTIRLYKYGRAIEISYESLRRMPIDLVAFHIARIAVQSEVDKLATVMDVALNGDGNSNSATNFNLTTLDAAATAGTLTLKGWLAFKMKFLNPYQLTTALVQSAVALQLQLLNTGSANVPLVAIQQQSFFGGFRPINPLLNEVVALGITADAPTLKVLAMDARFAIQRLVENGSDIDEVERFVLRQTQALTMSEVEGYAVLDANASKTLDVNA